MYEMKRNMIKSKKGSRKTIRTTLAAGMRGQLVIQESNHIITAEVVEYIHDVTLDYNIDV